jgi:enoyl-CoA hydratase/carnithine racemase
MPDLTRSDDVAVLHLGADENRLNRPWLDELGRCLDDVEADPPYALVTTATGKFWSTGLDLDWLGANPDVAQAFLDDVERTLARVLLLPTASVAAIQGHAFAAGAMLALAHDVRVMRADRGYFCLPEVDLPLPFTPGMAALIQAKLDATVAHEAMTTGRRYGGVDAADARIVAAAVEEAAVVSDATVRARSIGGKHAGTLTTIKQQMYGDVAAALRKATVTDSLPESGPSALPRK